MIRTLRIIAAAIVVTTSLATPSAQPRPAMAPADILRLTGVGDAQISPNGQWIVYTVSTVDGNETVSTLWLARTGNDLFNTAPTSLPPPSSPRGRPSDGPGSREAPTPLLARGWNVSNPRWSPDSATIAFRASHDDQSGIRQSGIWIISLDKVSLDKVSLDKSEPRFVASVQTTNFFITYAGESLAWSPDSKRIAYVSATEERSAASDRATQAVLPDDPRVIDRIQYKSRTSFSDSRRTHVWITAIDRPEPRQLTSGPFYDHAITFNPNGAEIAFLSNREPDPDANNNSDIFAVDLGGQTRQITETRGCEYEPAWSPDGKLIAYTATRRDVTTIDSIAEDTHVWVMSASGDVRREIAGEQDRRARSPRWSPDSRWVFFLAGDKGETVVFRVGADGGRIYPLQLTPFQRPRPEDRRPSPSTPTTPRGQPALGGRRRYQIGSFSISRGRNPQTLIGLTLSDSLFPAELWIASLDPGALAGPTPGARVSGHNDSLIRSFALIEPEELNFKSFDGTQIQGWLMKPARWRADRKYPMILSVHGGPHGMSGWGFNPTFQVYAAQGYAVLYLNPRGSSGYGQKFSDGTLNEWGGGDYRDLMAGVDEALGKHPWIDEHRMGVTGGSYGGFMTNWIITQTPRFKAAVASASVSNLISFYSTSLYQDLIHAEFGGFPWDNYDLLWQWSPLRYVKQAQTPTLFIHGELDNDVHITQAEEMYMALKRRGVETVLVRYPREGHGLREPKHRVDALERTLAWFDRYLK